MKYYAVKVGKQRGIYLDWDSCKEQVNGYKGAKHKSFKTIDEANRYLFPNDANYLNNSNENNSLKQQKKENEFSSQSLIDFMESKAVSK